MNAFNLPTIIKSKIKNHVILIVNSFCWALQKSSILVVVDSFLRFLRNQSSTPIHRMLTCDSILVFEALI